MVSRKEIILKIVSLSMHREVDQIAPPCPSTLKSNLVIPMGFRGRRSARWPMFETHGNGEEAPKKIQPC